MRKQETRNVLQEMFFKEALLQIIGFQKEKNEEAVFLSVERVNSSFNLLR